MNFLYSLFFYSSMFPWVSFGIIDLDLQPYFIIFSVVIFLFCNARLPLSIWMLMICFLFSVLIGIIYVKFDFYFLRAISSYAALFFTSAAYFIVLSRSDFNFKRHIIIANGIWILAGLLQVFFGKNCLDFLVTVRTSDDRGVTGLAPEPTFYAITLLFFSLILLKLSRYRLYGIYRYLLLANIIIIFFVAKSSLAILLFLIISATGFLLFSLTKLRYTVSLILFTLVGVFFISNVNDILPGSRVASLVSSVRFGISNVVLNDASVNERLRNVVYPLQGAYLNYGIPQGYHSFIDLTYSLNKYYSGYFWWGEISNKIKSGIGGAIYELGWAVIFIYAWIIGCFMSYGVKKGFFEIFSTFLIMSMAVPIAFPLFSLYVSMTLFLVNDKAISFRGACDNNNNCSI